MANDTTNVVEFNSNVAVLQRCSEIIGHINDARFRTTRFDSYAEVLGTPEEVLSHIVCLFKEICVELTEKEEAPIWSKIKILRDKLRVNPPSASNPSDSSYWKKTIADLDDLDIEIRKLAKKHGFLSANKKDVTKAALRR